MTDHYLIRIKQIGLPVNSMKSLRDSLHLNLREARELVDYLKSNVPCVLVSGINKDAADSLLAKLAGNNFDAVMEESEIDHPMMLRPKAGKKWKSHWLFGFQEED